MADNKEKEQIRQRYARNVKDDILIIPPNPIFSSEHTQQRELRVCAYCRVSTPDEAQTSSFETQRNYYEDYIQKHENWIYAGIYADEGITGTNTKKRDDFNRMVSDCYAGKIDLIVTKSVSRFSRNVVDCLTTVRRLNALNPVVGVFFQTENINTMNKGYETYLTILAVFSQEESRTKSDSMIWSYEKRFSNGNFLVPTKFLLGYDKMDGEIVIEPEGAKTVKLIFSMFRAGYSCTYIAHVLSELRRPTAKGNVIWSGSSVRNILQNERYCGDVVAQKTYTKDFYEHSSEKNHGQRPVYYKGSHHPGIVTREEYLQALLLLSSNSNSSGIDGSYSLTVIKKGLLAGFIPINRAFGGFDASHYIQAVLNSKIDIEFEENVYLLNLPGCEVVRIQDFKYKSCIGVSISIHDLSFNKACVALMPETEYVELLLDPVHQQIALRPANMNNINAFRWVDKKEHLTSITIGSTAFCKVLFKLMGWREDWRLKLTVNRFKKNNECVLLFDLLEPVYKLSVETDESNSSVQKKAVFLLPAEWRDNFGDNLPQHSISCRRNMAIKLDEWNINAPSEPANGFEQYCGSPTLNDINEQINSLMFSVTNT